MTQATNYVSRWEDLPEVYRVVKTAKKIAFQNNPFDKGLHNIFEPFLGKDKINERSAVLNFDKKGIAATNSHALLHLPYPNKEFIGSYCTLPSCIKLFSDTEKIEDNKIEGRYPDYPAVIPIDNPYVYPVTIAKLKTYCRAVLEGNYVNKTTYQVVFAFADNQPIGFNGKFVMDICNAFEKLGYSKAFIHLSTATRAAVFSPDKDDVRIGKSVLGLLMPVMLSN